MKFVGVVASVLLLLPSVAAPQLLDIRFCPTERVYAYPLDAEGRMKSLLLQGFAVINRDAKPVEIRNIRIELLRGGESFETRTLSASDIALWAGNQEGLMQFHKRLSISAAAT